MCGILFLAGREPLPPIGHLEVALARMDSRGPDHRQLQVGDGFAIGHTRLAIIDPAPEAHQPFWDPDGRHVLAYNGELYNYRELRDDLRASGVALHTRSDTEVLLQAVLHWGLERTLRRVRGMFAFVLYDTVSGELIVARDHFGQKPLYYTDWGGGVAVASDVLSLADLVGAAPDPTAYSVYLCPAGEQGTRGVFHADRTFFRGIRMLPAGHLLRGRPERLCEQRYFAVWDLFSAETLAHNQTRSQEDCMAELEAHLQRAVVRHLVSDVPVGVLLSGGIDSSLVYWMAQPNDPPIAAFTKLSPGIERIPLEVIPRILERRPADAQFVVQRPEDYLAGLVAFVRASRAPSRWGSGPPMARLCRAARQQGVRVLLTGDCADEYFGGYRHYETLGETADPAARDELVSLDGNSPFFVPGHAEGYEAREQEVRRQILERLRDLSDPAERTLQAALLHDTSSFLQTCNLPHGDAYAMAESVELRNPLLDMDLVRFAVNLPARYRAAHHCSGHFGKRLLRDLAGSLIGDFVNAGKEGTRNYAMRVADPQRWRLARFAIREFVPIPAQLSRRDMIRLMNLEIFHRSFFLGQEDFLDEITATD